jgi:hypothetical protein
VPENHLAITLPHPPLELGCGALKPCTVIHLLQCGHFTKYDNIRCINADANNKTIKILNVKLLTGSTKYPYRAITMNPTIAAQEIYTTIAFILPRLIFYSLVANNGSLCSL